MIKYFTERDIIKSSYFSEYIFKKKNKNSLSGRNKSRHIFIFFDGTWNEDRTLKGESIPTNVLRMFQEINKIRSIQIKYNDEVNDEIITHYYRGVGSRQDNNRVSQLWFGFNGKDEERIRSTAFADLYRDYRGEHDYIYIIGFSRGAASARLLAKDICIKGLPPKLHVRTKYFSNKLTSQIEARIDKVKRVDDDYKENYKPTVSFLGCWDTVDAFVLPNRFHEKSIWNKSKQKVSRFFKYISLPSVSGKEGFSIDERKIPLGVTQAVHCVAIDETRNAFLPSLMPPAPNVMEVWFAGVHSDIGGGYEENRLSFEPYNFMKEELKFIFNNNCSNRPNSSNVKKLFNNSKMNDNELNYCFHYHGLDAHVNKIKDIIGLGSNIRQIHILYSSIYSEDIDKDIFPDRPYPNNLYPYIDYLEPPYPLIHESVDNMIFSNNSIFAANAKNKKTWTITYNPYNVSELKGRYRYVRTSNSNSNRTMVGGTMVDYNSGRLVTTTSYVEE